MSSISTLVIPAYNEELRLPPTLERLHAFLAARPHALRDRRRRRRLEGQDVSGRRARGRAIPDLRLVRQLPEPRQGRRGPARHARSARADPRDVRRRRLDAARASCRACSRRSSPGKAEIAIGSRYAEGAKTDVKQPLLPRAVEPPRNKVIQRSLVPGVRDTQCGFKAFTAEAARDLFRRATIDGWAFDLEILALARRRGFAIDEVGVEWKDDEPLARQPAQGHVEGDPRGADDPPQPRAAASTEARLGRSVSRAAECEGPRRSRDGRRMTGVAIHTCRARVRCSDPRWSRSALRRPGRR